MRALFAALVLAAAPPAWSKTKAAPSPKVDIDVQEGTVSVDEPEGGLFRIGEDVRVARGQHRTGSVVVLGGSAQIEGDVDQDLVVVGGTAEVTGSVGGDVVVLGPRAHLGAGSRVKGSFVTLGADVGKDEGARVKGETVNLRGFGLGLLASAASGVGLLAALGMFFRFFSTLGWLLLALAAGAVAPRGLEACAASLRRRPIASLAVGIFFYPAAVAVAAAMLLSLVGIPLLPALGLAVAVLSAWAYLAAGQWLGGLVFKNASPWLPCFAGIAALQILGWIPVAGKALAILALFLGVGATLTAGLPRPSGSSS